MMFIHADTRGKLVAAAFAVALIAIGLYLLAGS